MRCSLLIASCAVILGLVPLTWAAELVNNPNRASSWKLEVLSGAAATIDEDEGGLRVNITQRGGQSSHVQVLQVGKHVADNTTYTMRFKAKASANRPLLINCQTADSPWRNVLQHAPTVNLTTSWQNYELPLTFQDVRGDALRAPSFVMGDITGTVWLKDVSVNDGTAATPSPAPSTPPTASQQQPAAGELLHDPMTPASWTFEVAGNAKATLDSQDGALRINVEKGSAEAWHVQMYQLPDGLVQGKAYTLLLTARASEGRKITFTSQQHGLGLEMLLPYTSFDVGTEWKQYKIRFTMKKLNPGKTRLPDFQFGSQRGTVFIRAMSLKPADNAN